MEISRTIKDAENALRDFIEYCLLKNFGENWPDRCGLAKDRVEHWRERKALAEAEFTPNVGEERLLYYAPFNDLTDLISINWEGDIQAAFNDRDIILAFIKVLEKFRDPDTFRRELFIYQKHLVIGISGEIRSRIAAYRSLLEVGKQGFPRIEHVKDNFGNSWAPGSPMRVRTNLTLRVGDTVEFIIQATDPEELPIEYRIHGHRWQAGNILLLQIEEKHVQKDAQINITIRSTRKFHAYPLGYDDRVVFMYQVLPR